MSRKIIINVGRSICRDRDLEQYQGYNRRDKKRPWWGDKNHGVGAVIYSNFLRRRRGARTKIKKESADKPGSVMDSHSSGMHVTVHLKQPTREQCGPHYRSPIWSCSGWGFPCHACYQSRGALLPHHFTLTCALRRIGGIFSVALSVGSRLPGVTWHPALWSPDFPLSPCGNSDCLANSAIIVSSTESPWAAAPKILTVSFSPQKSRAAKNSFDKIQSLQLYTKT